jgi:signal transduction histidine kinase
LAATESSRPDAAKGALSAQLLGELLALIAHDLRNPLSALRSNVGFIESLIEKPDDDSKEAIADALVSCDTIAHIIDNVELLIHELSGAEAQGRSPIPIGAVVVEAVERSKPLAQSHRVNVELAPGAKDVGLRVNANRDMLVRCVGNLVKNAIQHAGESPVTIGVRKDGNRAVVTVRDGGAALDLGQSVSPFTAPGQIACKHAPGGRYSRGLGLFSATIAARAAGATLGAVVSEPAGNQFELSLELA